MDWPGAFQRTYEALDRRVYRGALPAWPGVEVVDTYDVITAVNAWPGRDGAVRALAPFTVSRHVRDAALLREAFRHETAHVAAMVLDRHWGHGPSWVAHARACGAFPKATYDGVAWAAEAAPHR